MMDFEEWFESQDNIGCLIGLEGYAAEEAWNARQAEIDDLKNKMQTALNKACMLQNSSGERIYTELKEILK